MSQIANTSDEPFSENSLDGVNNKKDYRIPDFTLFDHHIQWAIPKTPLGDAARKIDSSLVQEARAAAKTPCLIVEIKPVIYRPDSSFDKPTDKFMKRIVVQVLGQVRWAMEEHGELLHLWALCAIGTDWSMIKVARDRVINLDPTLFGATHDDPTFQPTESEELLDLTVDFEIGLRAMEPLFKLESNDYSPEFRKAWDKVINDCHLSGTSWD